MQPHARIFPSAVAALALALCPGCALAPHRPAEGSRIPPAIPEEPARREEDLSFLVRELEARHPAFREPGGGGLKARFEADAASLRARLPSLGPEEALASLARLVASLGDGHTGLVVPASALLPIDVYRFEEGWYVIGASEACSALLGTRLVSVGGVPIAEAEAALAPLVPHDNASGLASQLRYRLLMPELLAGTGLLPRGAGPLRLACADAAGRRVEAEAAPLEVGAEYPELRPFAPSGPEPLSAGRREKSYWRAIVPGTRTLYIAYNRCRADPELPMRAFAKEIGALLDSGAADRVFVDLRGNGGGSQALFWPLLRVLASYAKGERAVPVFAAIGRRTFSSAVLNAIELNRGGPGILRPFAPSAGARLVGEDSGGKPNHYGDSRSFLLPNSGLRVQCSTKRFRYWPTEADSLVPELAVPATWADYAAGRDAVLEAVLALELGKGASE